MILFYDIETTGFNRANDEIIEIAAVVIDDDFNVVDQFDEFIKPSKPIPYQITQLTGISNAMVQDAAVEAVVVENFSRFVKKYNPMYIAGHNITAFDNSFILMKCDKYRIGHFIKEPYIDTLKTVRAMRKEGKLADYNYFTAAGNPSYKLENLMSYYSLGSQNHRAIDDVLNNIEVYKRLQKEDIDYGF